MTTALQLRRDTTSNLGAITPAQGEVVVDTTRKALALGDGSTAGGLTITPFTGTWTPALKFGGTAVGLTLTVNYANWVRIGPLVIAWFGITVTAKGSSTGAARIDGLPVASVTDAAAQINWWNALNTSPNMACYVGSGASSILLGKAGATAWAALADTDFTNTTQLEGVAIYQSAQPTG